MQVEAHRPPQHAHVLDQEGGVLEDGQRSHVGDERHQQQRTPARADGVLDGHAREVVDEDGEDEDEQVDGDEGGVKDAARGQQQHPAEPVRQQEVRDRDDRKEDQETERVEEHVPARPSGAQTTTASRSSALRGTRPWCADPPGAGVKRSSALGDRLCAAGWLVSVAVAMAAKIDPIEETGDSRADEWLRGYFQNTDTDHVAGRKKEESRRPLWKNIDYLRLR